MARFDRYTVPSVFNVLSADYFVGTTADITNVFLTTVSTLSVLNSPIVSLGVVGINYVHTNSLTAVTLTASEVIYAQGGNSLLWNEAYNAATTYQSASGNWQDTFTNVQSNSSFYIQSRSTLETPTTGISAINNIVVLSQSTYDTLTVKLPNTYYIIV